MKTFKTRHQFYLPDDLSEALDRLCSSSGSSKTAVLTEGLKAVLERRAGHELDIRFGVRLDRMSRGQERLENKVDLLAEAFGTFVHHQLTLVAHQPPFDEETRQLGLKRYQSFLELVGRRLASGSTLRLVNAIEKSAGLPQEK
ncbi:MAG: CopG family transcriptional regulator [Alphaproteobacteria bacterium]|nr:MAG: CopG family transcriptional regulator [Alphaproteobacteria bacterium]